MACSWKVGIILLWISLSQDKCKQTSAELTVNVLESHHLDRIVADNIYEVKMASDHPQNILMTTKKSFLAINIDNPAASATPESNLISNQDGLELSGFVQHDSFILAVSKHKCVMNVSLSGELTTPAVIAGKCGVSDHIDGPLDVARFSDPTHLVQNLIAANSYVIVDKSKIKIIDLVKKVVTTVKDLSHTTTIRDVAVSAAGVVFAVTSTDQEDNLVSFNLIDPDSDMQIFNSGIISGGLVFASPLFGTSLSSLTFVGDDMLAFTDSSNYALKIVQSETDNTSGILTICLPVNQSTIQFIDPEMHDQCNVSFRPSIVRAQDGKILVLSENGIIVFNLTDRDDETKSFDLGKVALHVSYSSVVGVLSIIVICLSIKYQQLKMRHGHEKRRHGLDISFPLQDTGIYLTESPPSAPPRPFATLPTHAPSSGSSTRYQSSATDPPTDTVVQNTGYNTADSSIYEMIIPNKKASIISDDESFYSTDEQTTPI